MSKNTEENDKNIETLLDDLDKLMVELDDGTLPLDKSFELYKKGVDLLSKCSASIDHVEKELIKIESVGKID